MKARAACRSCADCPARTFRRPRELAVTRAPIADDVAAFEQVLVDGSPLPCVRGGVLNPRILDNPHCHWFLGRPGSVAAACAMPFVIDALTCVYHVAVLPQYRRRGYGVALTAAATAAGTGKPVMLVANALGAPVYRRLGYEPAGEWTAWRTRPA